MPNWVKNVVTFHCEGRALAKIMDEIKYGDRVFDFNTLIPMPESLQMTSGSIEDEAIECFMKVDNSRWKDYYMNKKKLTEEQFTDLYNKGEQYITNKLKYGYTTWYGWCNANWGTKWNANGAHWEGNKLIFETAWGTPIPIFEVLSEKYKDVSFTVEFADEDLGRNCGIIKYYDGAGQGELIFDAEAFNFAKDLWWGYTDEDLKEWEEE